MTKNFTKNSKSPDLKALSLVVLFCFFFSGMAGLIYQILWLRIIDKVVGSAPFAVATVLSVFMGGLALGSYLAGKYIDRIVTKRNLLSLYGKAELLIGIYGLLLPLLIVAIKPIYVIAYNSLFMHFWLYRIFAFLGCSLLLIVPTTLMGVTLPVLCRFYVEDLGHIGARTGRLYGINTIGSAAGAVLCGFWLIAEFGVWGSLLTAVVINILVGVLCISLSRGGKAPASESIETRRDDIKTKVPEHPEVVTFDDNRIITLALWIFGISGFCSMAYEVFWTRLLGLIIGPTTYSFSLVVSTFIIGLALGNIIFGWLADRVKGTFHLLVITQVCAACLAILVSQFLGNSQFFFSKLIYTFQGDFGEKIFIQSVVLFLVLIGPTVFLGATFPLVNKIYARSLPSIGRSIGTAYAVNTIGAILGSFIAGFIFIPLLGKENGIRITIGIQIIISLAALTYLVLKAGFRTRASVTGLITLPLGLLLLINFPSWDHNILSRGWYYRFDAFEKYFSETSWLDAVWKGPSKIARHVSGNEIVFYGDGIGGFTTVEKCISPVGTYDYYLLNSGKTDASSRYDRLTQSLCAHIPLLFHPNPEKVMILGLASGMTAGEALLYPVKQLDVLEINDQVLKAAEFFTPWNNDCLTNPNTRIIVQDGRNHLELTREKYDVIISEPSNPWMAGLANLFTLDYFKTVKDRLNKDGIFIQWANAYDMDWDSFAMIGRTFAEVFPDGMLMSAISSKDFLLIGFSDEKNMDLDTADRNMVYARQSENITIKDPRVIFNLIATEDLKEFFGSGLLHTDNWPHLEFAAPKTMGKGTVPIEERLKNNSRFSDGTKEIIELNKNIDSSLDNLELMIADYFPPFKDINLSNATSGQIKRFNGILEDYCSKEYVSNYGIFPSHDLQEQCAPFQVARIQNHLNSGQGDSETYYSLAVGLRIMGNIGDEIDALHKAISLDPHYYNAYMELGAALGAQGRLEEALDQFSEALRIRPDSAETHNNLGVVFATLGRAAEAIESFSRAVNINPDLANAHNNLGSILEGQGRQDEAIDHFTKALTIQPDFAVAHDNLGRLLMGKGRIEDALNHFNKALKYAPDNANFHCDAGLCLMQHGEIDAAVARFSEALKIDPNHFSASYNLGIALLNQEKIEAATGHFFKAAEINTDDPGVRKILGMIMWNMGRFKEAAQYFSEALKLEPDSAETHDRLGVALAQMGQLEEAIEHFNKALEIDNSYETARNHLEIIRRGIQK